MKTKRNEKKLFFFLLYTDFLTNLGSYFVYLLSITHLHQFKIIFEFMGFINQMKSQKTRSRCNKHKICLQEVKLTRIGNNLVR